MSNKQVKVSVIMPVYNGDKFLEETVQSILSQTYSNFEFIIVDDCSTDNSYKILEKLAQLDNRIRLLKTESNYGNPGGTGAFAIRHVAEDSKYILPMDQDDLAAKKRLELSVDFMENHPDVDICGGWQKLFGAKSRVSKNVASDSEIKARLLTGCPFSHSTTIFRKAFFAKHDLNYKNDFCQDYRLWVEAFLNHNATFANIQQILLYYRVHNGQRSKGNQLIFQASDELRGEQLKKLGVTSQDEIDLHNDWKRKRLKRTPENLMRLKLHFLKILKLNRETKVYPAVALEKRLIHLYRYTLLKSKRLGNIFKALRKNPLQD